MPHIAYSKRSFGIENKKWINNLANFILVTILVQDLTLVIELVLVGIGWIKEYEGDKIEAPFVLSYFFCFILLQFFFYVPLSVAADTKGYSINLVRGCCAITVFTAVYVLNPWIITFKQNAELIHRTLKYTFIIHTLSIPLHFLASSLVIYILWRMSKVKPDYNGEEPYEVIYGGQDSETKKLLDTK